MTGYEFFDAMPESIKPGMADVFLLATEAFSTPVNNPDMPAGLMDEHERYDWKKASYIVVLCSRQVNQWHPDISLSLQKSLCLLAVSLLVHIHL